ncbi:ATP synthase F1 subunit gamma [Fusibacter ferrireducens]|uniref:ATP synthase gamma chain n=1 Tax=Fusibacter ferrireducens TaxID=2785058 RepID=A0ABR9ZVQ3_9FIRM|nr:ATP synthase F1 subunit gamma [Fusibacter ferrireducens]MBF4694539.1 ATP synthase F1 subunit gamma [Fusibacter ferrireducens]
MAGNMRDIKRKIRSVNSTMQITKAMELVSTAKLRRARSKMDITKPYFETVKQAVQDILSEDKSIRMSYVADREIKKTLYIVISGDRGLCGGYNINAIKKAISEVEDKKDAKFITIGKRAFDIINRYGYEIEDYFLGISEKPEYFDAIQIAKKAMSMFDSGEVDAVKFVYTRFVSTISQSPELIQLLPIEHDHSGEKETSDEFVNYEPSAEEVLKYVIPKYVESTIYGGLIESSASEQAARRVAMESASDNAADIIDELSLFYNQARQAAITQEISEIVSGAEALK